MLASLPFILLLILQGFARQDCAELFCSSKDLVNLPVQARSLKSFDDLFATLSLGGNDQKGSNDLNQDKGFNQETQIARNTDEGSSNLQDGYLEIQRSRDGPVG